MITKGTIMIAIGIIGILISITFLLVLIFKREKKKEVQIELVDNITIELQDEGETAEEMPSAGATKIMTSEAAKPAVQVRPIETELLAAAEKEVQKIANETQLLINGDETQLLTESKVPANETEILKEPQTAETELLMS